MNINLINSNLTKLQLEGDIILKIPDNLKYYTRKENYDFTSYYFY